MYMEVALSIDRYWTGKMMRSDLQCSVDNAKVADSKNPSIPEIGCKQYVPVMQDLFCVTEEVVTFRDKLKHADIRPGHLHGVGVRDGASALEYFTLGFVLRRD